MNAVVATAVVESDPQADRDDGQGMRIVSNKNERRLESYLVTTSPFTPILGFTRSLMALATLLTLLLTPTGQLFFRSEAIPTGVNCGGVVGQFGLFCVGSDVGNLEMSRWIGIAILALVLVGVAPAVTAIPHWYVTWSLMTSSTAVDGGEHLSANLTLILIPILLLDRRLWHWSRDSKYAARSPWVKVVAYCALALFIAQVMGVYFQASIAKFGVLEWSDGTALWYWMQNPTFSPPEPFGDIVRALLQYLPVVVAATYGTLILQLSLVPAPFFPLSLRRALLGLAVLFHLGIAATMGLWSFSMIMIAADLLLLIRPHEANSLNALRHWRTRSSTKEIS